MKSRWLVRRGIAIALLVTIVIAGIGLAVLQLWNWLMPSIFGLHPIGFWQAIGLLALSWILFGGHRGVWHGGGRGYRRRWRQGMRERWEQMTPEQRDKFREALEGRCGPFQRPAAEPKA